MKISYRLPAVNLREVQKFDEFLALSKHVDKSLPLIKISDKYPSLTPMRTEHPDLSKDPGSQQYKFKSQMYNHEPEFLRAAYQAVIEVEDARRKEARAEIERNLTRDAIGERAFSEQANMKKRIEDGWKIRILMEKMFAKAKVVSMDEFKEMMHRFFTLADERHREEIKIYIRQAGLDNASKISNIVRAPSELAREAQDQMLVENKIKHDAVFDEIRQKMAEQHATLVMSQVMKKTG